MTVEAPTKENPTQEAETATEGKKEMVALSLKQESETKGETASLVHQPTVASTLPGGRPIEQSHLQVVNTYTSVGGDRPVVASGMKISSTLAVSGNRPISAGLLKIDETYMIMGNRPIASNAIDDPALLMGYLD